MNVTRGTWTAAIALGAALILAACGDDGGSATGAGGTAAATATTAASSTPAATGATTTKSSGDGYYSSDSGSASATTVAKATATTTAPATTTPAASSSATMVQVADVKGVGSVLVDGAGRALYLFDKDSGTTSACTVDPCKKAWPAFAGAGLATAGAGVQASKLGTADAQLPGQVTYNGHLLYYFAGDKAPGDATGAGIPGWHLLDGNGDKIG